MKIDATTPAGYSPAMTEESRPTIHRTAEDPLGYDIRRSFREWAREMADDAIAGRHQEAIDAEIERVRKRWRISEWRTGTKP